MRPRQGAESTGVVAIAQAPAPYYTPVLNALGELVRLHVIYVGGARKPTADRAAWSDFEDPWGVLPRFEYSFYPSISASIRRLDFSARFSLGVSVAIARLNPAG